MVKADNLIEIEIDGPRNESLMFAPLMKRVRGRFDFNRVAEPLARMQTSRWPDPIPGQRLALDADSGEAAIVDGIHDAPSVKARVEKNGFRLPPQREELGKVDLPTWLFWLRLAVDSGVARVVKGQLPHRDEIKGEIKKHFITRPPAKSNNTRLAEAIEANTAVLAELLKKLVK